MLTIFLKVVKMSKKCGHCSWNHDCSFVASFFWHYEKLGKWYPHATIAVIDHTVKLRTHLQESLISLSCYNSKHDIILLEYVMIGI